MTVGYGIGMFFYGMGCLCIGAFIAYKIINRKSSEERENEEYLKLTPIKNLGIFCFEPEKIQSVDKNPSFNMKTQYYPIQRDDDYLFKFITEILDFLEGPKPNFDEKCGLCNLKKNNFSS